MNDTVGMSTSNYQCNSLISMIPIPQLPRSQRIKWAIRSVGPSAI